MKGGIHVFFSFFFQIDEHLARAMARGREGIMEGGVVLQALTFRAVYSSSVFLPPEVTRSELGYNHEGCTLKAKATVTYRWPCDWLMADLRPGVSGLQP